MITKNLLGEQAEKLVDKWKGLLEGINGDYDRYVLAHMLENQRVHGIKEATDSSAVATFTTYSFPLIRRIYPKLIARELVSVQPIPMPTGLIFYLDFEYGSDRPPVRRGDRMDYYSGGQNPPGSNIRKAVNYTKNWVRGHIVGTGDGTDTTFNLGFAPVKANANLKVYVDAVALTVIYSGNPTAGQVRVDVETGDLTFGAAPANGAVITADFDLHLEGDKSQIPEINLTMSSDSVAAETRKLKTRWTLELQQDLQAYHGLSAETELTKHAANEIATEIDREILNDLLNAASTNVNWISSYPGTSSGYDKKEYDETFFHAILEADNAIWKKRFRRSNWIVTSPDIATRMEKIQGFRYLGDVEGGQIASGPALFGSLRNRWNVYVDPMFPENKLLLGYRGEQFFETGYVWAPYIPLIITPQFMDPNDFTPRRGLMTRNAKKLVSSDFYASVTVI